MTGPGETDPLMGLNADAQAGAVTDVLHGVPVPDPFRSLELDTEDTHRWVEAQNAHTLATLAPHQRA